MADGPQRRLSEAKNFISDRAVWSALDRSRSYKHRRPHPQMALQTGRALRPVQIVETAILSSLDDPADRDPIYRSCCI